MKLRAAASITKKGVKQYDSMCMAVVILEEKY